MTSRDKHFAKVSCLASGNKQTKKELGRMLATKAQFQEIVYHLLHSWKIASEPSWFADIPLIATNTKTFGRLEVY